MPTAPDRPPAARQPARSSDTLGMSPFGPLAINQHWARNSPPAPPKMPRHCPNDPSHKQFLATVQVTQDWLVDEHGECIEVIDDGAQEETDLVDDAAWTCATCGALAESEESL
jgi:hypothetical protein